MVLGIYGAGATAQELYEMIQAMKMHWEDIVFIDDTQPDGEFLGKKRVPFTCFAQTYDIENTQAVIAVGEPSVRAGMHERIREKNYRLATIVHPTSMIAETAQIDDGCVLKMHTIVSSNTHLKENVYVQSCAVIGHDVTVGRDSIVSGGAFIAGNCTLGESSFVGIHSCIREKTVLGDHVVVAMMSAVMKNVESGCMVSGNPARVMKWNKDHIIFQR